MSGDLPLFAWIPPAQPECIFMTFPLDRQTGKVRAVAAKLLDKRTDRHAAFYRSQSTRRSASGSRGWASRSENRSGRRRLSGWR